jgi:predicted RND superfamily exporter protein
MFKRLAKLILRNRYLFLIVISIITILMGWQATHIQLSYEFAKILPATDPDYQAYHLKRSSVKTVLLCSLEFRIHLCSNLVSTMHGGN